VDTSDISTRPRWLSAYFALRASRPGFWLALALVAQLVGIVAAVGHYGSAGPIGAALLSIALLWPIRRGVLFAWQLFALIHWVQLALVPVFVLLALFVPGGDLMVYPLGIVATAVGLWAITAKCVRVVAP
jgi:hypothetical protein